MKPGIARTFLFVGLPAAVATVGLVFAVANFLRR